MCCRAGICVWSKPESLIKDWLLQWNPDQGPLLTSPVPFPAQSSAWILWKPKGWLSMAPLSAGWCYGGVKFPSQNLQWFRSWPVRLMEIYFFTAGPCLYFNHFSKEQRQVRQACCMIMRFTLTAAFVWREFLTVPRHQAGMALPGIVQTFTL